MVVLPYNFSSEVRRPICILDMRLQFRSGLMLSLLLGYQSFNV